MIVLLTDFGQSEYVGAMKGVISNVNRDAQIVDLCHDIAPQCIIEAAWILKNNVKYFPKGTTFCCVVDPGVGTDRKALAVNTSDYHFVAPDNGLLWETLRDQSGCQIRELPIPENASKTFHGRDVFAKAAAHVDAGRFAEQGPNVTEIEKLDLSPDGRKGMVVRIDRFGNVITNLPRLSKTAYRVEMVDKSLWLNFYPTYGSAEENDLFLIEGSCNTLEISLKNASAQDKLKVKPGTLVVIS